MTSYLRIFVAAGAVLAGASVAFAQERLSVAVPFAFTTGDAQFVRGTYSVSRMQGDALLLQGARGGAFVLGQSDGWDANLTQAPKLVFHRYGGLNFLREIQFGDGTAIALPESKQERDAAERRASAAFETIEIVVRG